MWLKNPSWCNFVEIRRYLPALIDLGVMPVQLPLVLDEIIDKNLASKRRYLVAPQRDIVGSQLPSKEEVLALTISTGSTF